MPGGVCLTVPELFELVRRALVRHGMSEANAPFVADVVAAAERDGAKSHGLLRLPGYMASLAQGDVDGKAVPHVTRQTPVVFAVDAGNGFAQIAVAAVRDQAIEAARAMGVAVVAIRDAHHFAALWPDVESFATHGLLALSMVNSRSHIVTWGGKDKVLGTNPVAFACPRAGHPPIVWDQASSMRAQGEVILARNHGERVPPGVGVDSSGNETGDPAAILDGGALLPFAGAKGGNIAFMVEILVAAFGGGPFGFEVPPQAVTGRTGQFLLLLDPGSTTGGSFSGRVELLVAALEAAGASRLPAERRYRNRAAALSSGLLLSAVEHAELALAGG